MNANFTMFDGVIANNTAIGEVVFVGIGGGRLSGSGGGGVVAGSFSMFRGVIANNTAEGHGGGVYVGYRGHFILSGGEITGNTATYGGV